MGILRFCRMLLSTSNYNTELWQLSYLFIMWCMVTLLYNFETNNQINKQNIGLRIRKAIFQCSIAIHWLCAVWVSFCDVLTTRTQRPPSSNTNCPVAGKQSSWIAAKKYDSLSLSPWDNVALHFQGCTKPRKSYVLPSKMYS